MKLLSKIIPAPVKKMLKPVYRLTNRENDLPSSLAIDTFDRFEIAYRAHTADEKVIKHSFKNDIFFPEIPEYRPKNNHTIIDVGAHIGTFSVLAADKLKKGKVFAIEASKESFNYLKINCALNNLHNLHVFHLALSDKKGNCTLYHSAGNWGHSAVKKLSSSREVVKADSLSSFLKTNKITKCDLIKFNC